MKKEEHLCECGHVRGDHSRNNAECINEECACGVYREDRASVVHNYRKLAMPILVKIAQEHGGLSAGSLIGPSRYSEVVRARHHAMAVLRWSAGWSFPLIGKIFCRDHTTVMAAVKKWEAIVNQ